MLSLSAAEVTRARTLAAPRERVWELVADPHHQPRWWPGVERIEGVSEGRFTQVMRTRRGRPVRLDFSIVECDAPAVVRWRQELAGTPFAGVLELCTVAVAIAPAQGGHTTVTITQRQSLRGSVRTGGLMLRRATRRRLDEALDGLDAVLLTAP